MSRHLERTAIAVSDTQGLALLVAGADGDDDVARPLLKAQQLGLLGEALLRSEPPWSVTRLANGHRRDAPTRPRLKREFDEIVRRRPPILIILLSGTVIGAPSGPLLVTGTAYREYPEDCTLSLEWMAERLRVSGIDRVAIMLSVVRVGDLPLDEVAAPFHSTAASHLVAVEDLEAGDLLVERATSGLLGDAFDSATGTVTIGSLAQHLARHVPGIKLRHSARTTTICAPAPLARRVELSRSRHPARRSSADAVVGPPALSPGSVLPGGIRLDAVIATGAFGTVYRAQQLAIQRDVAVKVLQTVDPGSDDARLFIQEIQAVGRIDHPHIVRIHQAEVTADGRLFFAMELLAGRDLDSLLADGPLHLARALLLAGQLLSALAAAHDAGLVHADVKPANVLVVPSRDAERLVLVDFGLSRLRGSGEPVESVGGTPAFMAPEQLAGGRIDARSDVFSAALVVMAMVTGWRRRSLAEVVPPLVDRVPPALAAVLARALAVDPAGRYPTAAAFAAALRGEPAPDEGPGPRSPFRKLAPFTEHDEGRLHGRERELTTLASAVLYGRVTVVAAPSGSGKTSTLRAGLAPRLRAAGARVHYQSCRQDPTVPAPIAEADGGARWVVILDQFEALLGTAAPLLTVLGTAPLPERVSVLVSVREDSLAVVLDALRRVEDLDVVRLGPLDPDSARRAIEWPLAEHRLAIEPALLDLLVADLQRATLPLAASFGWTTGAVYPAHLQLACAVLYDALPGNETRLNVEHYRRLGGLSAIIGEHLDRVVETQLGADEKAAARDIFLALVVGEQVRAARTDAELRALLASKHPGVDVDALLETLRVNGLVVRTQRGEQEAVWELVHDSLVPRVLGWIDRRDLDRRRALEMVRHHLRRSRGELPSLLTRSELNELGRHRGALDELDDEWRRRASADASGWTPSSLVARSRRAVRRTTAAIASATFAVAAVAAILGIDRWRAAEARERDRRLRAADLGLVAFELAPFDWDPSELAPRPVAAVDLPALRWELHEVDPLDPALPGPAVDGARVRHLTSERGGGGATRIDHAEVPGGAAFLVIRGRGRAGEDCAASTIPLRALPGYARRERGERRYLLHVPTCRATRADVVDIPAGPFVHNVDEADGTGTRDELVELSGYAVDRTEVTRGAFAVYEGMRDLTGDASAPAPYLRLDREGGARLPIVGVNITIARRYCHYLGKELPTNDQWQKAFRGGLTLGDRGNPDPLRSTPWIGAVGDRPANTAPLTGHGDLAPVGSHPDDTSPYGVVDLGGNVAEWTLTTPAITRFRELRTIIGGDWDTPASYETFEITWRNTRPDGYLDFTIGFRCVTAR